MKLSARANPRSPAAQAARAWQRLQRLVCLGTAVVGLLLGY